MSRNLTVAVLDAQKYEQELIIRRRPGLAGHVAECACSILPPRTAPRGFGAHHSAESALACPDSRRTMRTVSLQQIQQAAIPACLPTINKWLNGSSKPLAKASHKSNSWPARGRTEKWQMCHCVHARTQVVATNGDRRSCGFSLSG